MPKAAGRWLAPTSDRRDGDGAAYLGGPVVPDMDMKAKHYRNLAIMGALSFFAMYVLMYAMVDRLANVQNNFNQAYMAGLMAAPMVAIEILIMREMYGHKKVNAAILLGSVLALVVCFMAIRSQAAIGDTQFLRSMIPHHGGAILMCEQASLNDPEIKKLCEQIRASQQAEIAQMKAKLEALER